MEPQNQNVEASNSPAKTGSTKKIIIIIIVLVVLFGISKFFSRGSYMMPYGAGVGVDKNLDGSATYSNKEGSVTVGGGTYPDNWPNDLPKYSGAKIQYSASTNPQSGSAGSALAFTTADSAQKVLDFYKKELVAKGWSIEQTANIGQMTIISAKKGENTFGAQIVTGEDGQTTVTIGVGQ